MESALPGRKLPIFKAGPHFEKHRSGQSGWQKALAGAPGQEAAVSCCAPPKLQQVFKSKSFSICCVLSVNLQCFEMVVLDNFSSFMLIS